jgi:hypothetical protein
MVRDQQGIRGASCSGRYKNRSIATLGPDQLAASTNMMIAAGHGIDSEVAPLNH